MNDEDCPDHGHEELVAIVLIAPKVIVGHLDVTQRVSEYLSQDRQSWVHVLIIFFFAKLCTGQDVHGKYEENVENEDDHEVLDII